MIKKSEPEYNKRTLEEELKTITVNVVSKLDHYERYVMLLYATKIKLKGTNEQIFEKLLQQIKQWQKKSSSTKKQEKG